MNVKPLYQKWLDRSRSNLERAKIDSFSRNMYILYEDMCFDCQQSVEKALKGFMVFRNIKFEWTHDIGTLIKTLEDNNIEVPDNIKRSASLSVYAVRTRYPGEEEPITREEFQEALSTADTVFEWVRNQLEEAEHPEPMSLNKDIFPPAPGKTATGKSDTETERNDVKKPPDQKGIIDSK